MEHHFSDRKQNKRKLTSANAEPRMLNDFRFREQVHPRVAATEDGQNAYLFLFHDSSICLFVYRRILTSYQQCIVYSFDVRRGPCCELSYILSYV